MIKCRCITFADDVVVVAESKKVLIEIINKSSALSEEYGMNIKINKTRIMVIRREEEQVNIKLKKKKTNKEIRNFIYLGSMIEGYIKSYRKELRVRITMRKGKFKKNRSYTSWTVG